MTVTCWECGSVFSSVSNVSRHIRQVHNSEEQSVPSITSHFKCLEEGCGSYFKKNENLISHLTDSHRIQFEYEELTMKDMTDFLKWKSSIESNKWRYILKSKNKCPNGLRYYYYCNRSGRGKDLRNEDQYIYKRCIKSQGSCKMGFHCTSNIKLFSYKEKLTCVWQKVHYGHVSELHHLRLSKFDRSMVASKLISGLLPSQILESVKCNISGELNRLDLLTMKDILNIRTAFNVAASNQKRKGQDEAFDDALIKGCSLMPSKTMRMKGLLSDISCKLQKSNLSKLNDVIIDDINDHLTHIRNLLEKTELKCNGDCNYLNNEVTHKTKTIKTFSVISQNMEKDKNHKVLPVGGIRNKTSVSNLFISQSPSHDHMY